MNRRGFFRGVLAAAGFAAARVYAPKALSGVAAPKPTSVYTVAWQESLPSPSWQSMGSPFSPSKTTLVDSAGYSDRALRAFFYGNTQTEQDFR